MTRKCQNHTLQTNPRHHEEKPQNTNSNMTSKGNQLPSPARWLQNMLGYVLNGIHNICFENRVGLDQMVSASRSTLFLKQMLWMLMTGMVSVNPILHNDAFWHFWNMYLKILWKMEHLLIWSNCSIFHNIFKSIQNLTEIFLEFFSMLSKNRKWCHDQKIAYGVNGYLGGVKDAWYKG